MTIAERRISLEEFLALPEQKPALEYFNGRVSQKVSPRFRHSLLQEEIARHSNNLLLELRQGLALTELRVTMGGQSAVPDVAIFRWNRIPRDASGEFLDDVTIPPDIVVEVLSPGQSRRQLLAKCDWYVEQGVHAAVLVHPRARWIDVVRADQPVTRLGLDDTLDLSDVIPDLVLAVRDIFALLTVS